MHAINWFWPDKRIQTGDQKELNVFWGCNMVMWCPIRWYFVGLEMHEIKFMYMESVCVRACNKYHHLFETKMRFWVEQLHGSLHLMCILSKRNKFLFSSSIGTFVHSCSKIKTKKMYLYEKLFATRREKKVNGNPKSSRILLCNTK